MNKSFIHKLLNDKLTDTDRVKIHRWLSRTDSDKELKRILKEDWLFFEENNEKIDKKGEPHLHILNKIHGQIDKQKLSTKNRSIWHITKAVAASFLFILSAFFLYKEVVGPSKTDTVEQHAISNIVKSTGPGEKLAITLPDNSTVILNSNSILTIPKDFGRKDRVLGLEGEAYFEVASNPLKPFKVRSGKLTTTALGTAFNVFSRAEKLEVSLTEGMVKVASQKGNVTLSPGQNAKIHPSSNQKITIGVFDKSKVTSWKEGKISFENKTLKEIFLLLEKWYGVHITVKELDESLRVSGTFDNENLKSILTGLSFSLDFKFMIENKEVLINQ
ncbi:FecR family protein [Echinicola strongylocentroti]|uniref:FecR family protein n=1 Tax=Echinicola strongylocentroti TaxID=1795355 RepID=UPI0013A7094F|nr:FecR domain-containing protein [Echinicola strongylocentroti]